MPLRNCEWCGEQFEPMGKRGPVALYCGRACRQRAYESRRLDEALQDVLVAVGRRNSYAKVRDSFREAVGFGSKDT